MEEKVCRTCKWYKEPEGVCCNGDSYFTGDYRWLQEDTCEDWERMEEE